MEEIWKKVPGFEHYEVSNRGRVKSLARVIMRKNGIPDTKKEKILKPGAVPKGYLFVNLHKEGKPKSFYVHRLVLLTFEGPSDLDVDHWDRDKTNNNLDNLRYLGKRLNIRRRDIPKSSSFTGVHYAPANRKWKSQIVIEGKQYYLGYYKDQSEASNAYEEALYNWKKYKRLPINK